MAKSKPKPHIRYDLCMACGCCIQACPIGCLEPRTGLGLANKDYPALVENRQCSGCGLCVTACPEECITIYHKRSAIKEKSYVVVTDAAEMNYLQDFVSLPQEYGSSAYFERADVKAIYDTVYKNLNDLDEKVKFSLKLKNRRVLIKPNLVSVYNNMGFKDVDYPESTDPRVFEAVVSYIKQYTDNIVIIESSGKGMPTRMSFKISGLDRVAKYYGITCVALETLPVVRYLLPKASVMKEVYLPNILDEVVRGEAFYISVPKMKTNMYTGVTLGFKNAMGTIPYNLRQRNHTYLINKKLVDLLYLFKPDLVVIDGIIGGEGNTPAPVDPVDVRVIISGNNSVETDRVATRMMGINPDENKLMIEAVKNGFNDLDVTVIGTQKVVPFRQANSSLMDAEFRRDFPGVKTLVGYSFNGAPKIDDIKHVSPETVLKMEKTCDGGCLPAVKTAFEFIKYSTNPDRSFEFVLILGDGVALDGKRYYFDADGNAYDSEAIKAMKQKKVTIGECTKALKPYCEINGNGCCSSSSCLLATFKAVGRNVPALSFQNKHFTGILFETLRLYFARRSLIRKGQWVDCPYEAIDKIYKIPELSEQDKQYDYLEWPLPEMDEALKKKLLKDVTLF